MARSGSRVKDAVLATARDLVVENGADQLKMTTVLRTAGISRGTLYNAVRNKDELLVALVAESIDELADEVIAQGEGDLFGSLLALGERLAKDALASSLRESAAKDARNVGWCANASITRAAKSGVGRVLAATGVLANGPAEAEVELVMRWAFSQVVAPQTGNDLRDAALLLVKACR
jgi:AcrR family transcriptional regulator